MKGIKTRFQTTFNHKVLKDVAEVNIFKAFLWYDQIWPCLFTDNPSGISAFSFCKYQKSPKNPPTTKSILNI